MPICTRFGDRGVSQGHSDAIRKINGVSDARQYTVPVEETLKKIRNGVNTEYTNRDMHKRVCYVATYKWADRQKIEQEIKNMPHYFKEYDTIVNFVSHEELAKKHVKLPHGGTVIGVGKTTNNVNQKMEFKLELDSNPEFTAAILITYARAAYRMWQEGIRGCKTFLDVAPKYLSNLSWNEIANNLL